MAQCASAPARYSRFFELSQLVALQPNLHNGHQYLRPHLDEPLHDGFGVLIVTVAVRGSAQIIIKAEPWEPKRRRDFCFHLPEGSAYMLCAAARNR